MSREIPGFLKTWLEKAKNYSASDLHLIVNAPPLVRIHGEILGLERTEPIKPEHTLKLTQALLTPEQREELEKKRELCFSLSLPELGYFRINFYFKQGYPEASIRIGLDKPKSFAELGLPEVLAELTRKNNGLILITGPTGSGKTTTMNATIDFINHDQRVKIVTVEDPVEYLHKNHKSVIVQIEVGSDALGFHQALRNILRQDPDIICIGEMRDLETISAALTAAETGHLVIATLHTADASQTVTRIVDVFPPHQQTQIRFQLSLTLQAVISQRLLPMADKKGRVLAYEILIANEAIRNLIRENKIQQIENSILTGEASGMKLMDYSIRDLYHQGLISYDIAVSNMKNPKLIAKN